MISMTCKYTVIRSQFIVCAKMASFNWA